MFLASHGDFDAEVSSHVSGLIADANHSDIGGVTRVLAMVAINNVDASPQSLIPVPVMQRDGVNPSFGTVSCQVTAVETLCIQFWIQRFQRFWR